VEVKSKDEVLASVDPKGNLECMTFMSEMLKYCGQQFRVYKRALYDLFQKVRGGIPYPNRPGLIPMGAKTPAGEPLNIQAGELVSVKAFDEIRSTLNREARNRRLLFGQEMVPHCGQVFRVHSRVSRIIDGKTGQMLHFGNDSIILENVICRGRHNAGLSFCPGRTRIGEKSGLKA
jgi:hypothetical protein